MDYPELTVRVLGDFNSTEYARLVHEIGLRLRAAGFGGRTVIMTDGRVVSLENDPE
ncbi:hypothetical protein [Actinocrispum sp. NPDC049592]|uniref:hypothetical protein n=1 Tax=Actinocrispum sp. NPDC049592 TaxID=3154835 RepID=UPI00343E7668